MYIIMNTCTRIILFFIVILVVVVSTIAYKEKFTIELHKLPYMESCWQHIVNNFKWDVDSYEDGEKKVLLSMRKLNANSFDDDNKFFPGWNSCVIPKEHLPLFNIPESSMNDIDINKPDENTGLDPNSPTFMRYTSMNEHPDGYVVNLSHHNEKTFKGFLNKAWQEYDKEFFIEKKKLDDEIAKWEGIKRQKEEQLRSLKADIAWNTEEYNKLLVPSSECQKDRVEMENLMTLYDSLTNINNGLLRSIESYDNGKNNNNSQIDKMINDYNAYSGNPVITRDSLRQLNK